MTAKEHPHHVARYGFVARETTPGLAETHPDLPLDDLKSYAEEISANVVADFSEVQEPPMSNESHTPYAHPNLAQQVADILKTSATAINNEIEKAFCGIDRKRVEELEKECVRLAKALSKEFEKGEYLRQMSKTLEADLHIAKPSISEVVAERDRLRREVVRLGQALPNVDAKEMSRVLVMTKCKTPEHVINRMNYLEGKVREASHMKAQRDEAIEEVAKAHKALQSAGLLSGPVDG